MSLKPNNPLDQETTLEVIPVPQVSELIQFPNEIKRELSERHLRHFVKNAWHTVEPTREFKPNWHIDAICDHLEAVSRHDIRNLLVNIPPRFMKSLIISVLWPAWDWINKPSSRWLYGSYALQLATRDSVKTRNVINSVWYQSNWGPHSFHNGELTYKFKGDMNAKQRYENTRTGHRLVTAVNAGATGEGGDYVVADDPHNVIDVESDVKREEVLLWWDDVMCSRLDDQTAGGKVIVMQRTHDNDLSGHIIEKGNFEHLMLPMEFDPDRKCITCIGWEDPRTEENENMWPSRYPDKTLVEMQADTSEYAWSTQYDQNPAQREGAMFKINNFVMVDGYDYPQLLGAEETFEDENGDKVLVYDEIWRSWDKAGTKGGGTYTVGALIGRRNNHDTYLPNIPRFILIDIVRGQWATHVREAKIRETAEKDGYDVKILIEQEPAAGGKESAEATIDNLAGFYVKADTVGGEGSKEKRADPFSVQVNNGNVGLITATWNKPYKKEARVFPNSKYKDQIDASAAGFQKIAKPFRVHV